MPDPTPLASPEMRTLPATPAVRGVWAFGPASLLEQRVRAASERVRALYAAAGSLSLESGTASDALAAQALTASGKLSAVRGYLTAPNGRWMRAIDHLTDSANVDPAQTQGVLIETSSHAGAGLSPIGETDLPAGNVSIVRGSGIPGDNMELSALHASAENLSPSAAGTSALANPGAEPVVSFQPGDRTHTEATSSPLSTVTFDWERLYVPARQPCVKQGTAYVHDASRGGQTDVKVVTRDYGWTATVDGVAGVRLAAFSEDLSPLTLTLALDLGSLQPVSHVNIAVRQVGGLWPTIESVDVSGDGTTFFDLRCRGVLTWTGDALASPSGTSPASGLGATGSSLWSVPAFGSDVPPVRYVQVKFIQPKYYECPQGIGHPYYVEVTETVKKSSSWFGLSHSSSDVTDVQRLSGPEPLLGITAGQTSAKGDNGNLLSKVGVALSANPATVAYGVGLQVLGSLWGNSSSSSKVLQAGEYVDVFQGFRQCISVAHFGAISRAFATGSPGRLVTRDFSWDQSFSAVRLQVDDDVPASTSILYELSFDKGQSWQTVTPTDLALPTSSVQAVTLPSPQTTVRLRATLSTTSEHVTPRLYGYAIESLPAA